FTRKPVIDCGNERSLREATPERGGYNTTLQNFARLPPQHSRLLPTLKTKSTVNNEAAPP
ncbi:hypothetical protein HAX54_011199, partial [Datura stramonium]|nr:hypothetical protein [Datura stramonium]